MYVGTQFKSRSDVSVALALSTLRLTAEHALIIPLTPVNHDVIVEDA